jgi:hypothetical protein
MQSDVTKTAAAQKGAKPPTFQKRIGSTTYRVIVHFNEAAKETAEDKLLRLMESEVREIA